MPQGAWEGKPGADPLEVARGELREETGLEAARMVHAGELFESYGCSNQRFNVFLATGLRGGAASREPSEQDMVSRDFPLAEVERMIRDGKIKDGTTVAAFGLLRLKGLL
jgi:ADP-ribose pyrophosphatase